MKKNLRRLTSLMLVIIMLINMFPAYAADGQDDSDGLNIGDQGIMFVNVDDGYSTTVADLTPYITGYTLKSANDMTVELEVSYHIKPTDTNSDGKLTEDELPLIDESQDNMIINKWYFTLDEVGVAAWDTASSTTGTVTFGDVVVGRFDVINKSYNVTFNNNSNLLSTGSASENGISGKLWVKGELAYDEATEKDVVRRTIGGTTYTFYPHGTGDLYVSKSVKSGFTYKNDGVVEWVIVVSTEDGTNGEITLTDTLPGGFEITNVTADLYNNTGSVSYSGNEITLPALPYVEGAQPSHTVYVTTRGNPSFKTSSSSTTGLTTITNKVEATATGYDNNTVTSNEASAQFTRENPIITKEGLDVYDNGEMDWKITVNSSGKNIHGMVLEDEKLKKAIGAVTITPNSGYTLDQGNGTVSFTSSSGVNTGTYTIQYSTAPDATWVPSVSLGGTTHNNVAAYAENTAVLKFDGVEIDDASDYQVFYVDGTNLIKKESTGIQENREVTYTITINSGKAWDLSEVTGLVDYLTDADDNFPAGFTLLDKTVYKKDGSTISGIEKADSISGIMENLLNQIQSDSENPDGTPKTNTSCYTVSYTFKVDDYAEGKVTNFAQISFNGMNFSGSVGPESYTALYPLEVNKSSSVDYPNDRIKWEVIINSQFNPMGTSAITDKITAGTSYYLKGTDSRNNANNTPVIQLYSKNAETGEVTLVTTISEDFADENKLFARVAQETKEKSYKAVVTYYTSIEKRGTVTNTLTYSYWGQTKTATANAIIDYTYGINKSTRPVGENQPAYEEIKNEDGEIVEYKLYWTTTVSLPDTYNLAHTLTIYDDYGATQYMTQADKNELEANIDTAFGAANVGSVTHTATDYYFTLNKTPGTVIDLGKATGTTTVSYNYSTRVAPKDFVGELRNAVKYKIDRGDYTGNVTAMIVQPIPDAVPISKDFDDNLLVGADDGTDVMAVDPNGTLRWTINTTVPVGRNQFTITDTLPSELKLTNLKVSVAGEQKLDRDASSDGSLSSGSTSTGKITTYTTDSNKKVVVKFNPGHYYAVGAPVTVVIECKVKNPSTFGNDVAKSTKSVTNGVKIAVTETNAERDLGSTSDTVEIWVPKDVACLKSGEKVSENLMFNVVEYSVKINTEGADLLTDAEEKLEAVDTITWEAQSGYTVDPVIIPDSIKLYEIDGNGNRVNEISFNYTLIEDTNSRGISMSLPDGQALELVYQYKINVSGGSSSAAPSITLKNEFRMVGVEYRVIEDNELTNTFKTSAGGTAVTDLVVFYKHDSISMGTRLAGAKFTLYQYDDEVEGNWATVDTYPTDANGMLQGASYQEKTIYKLVETEAPDGYFLNETPFIFVVGELDDEEKLVGISPNVLSVGGYKFIPNDAKTEIKVQKTWGDNELWGNSRPETIKVTAYNKKDPNNTEYQKTITATLKQDGSWSGTIGDLRKYDDNREEIEYAVKEETINGVFKPEYSGDMENGFVISNCLEKVSVKVDKEWINGKTNAHENWKVTVRVLNHGKEITGFSDDALATLTAELNRGNKWSYTFENLPKYINDEVAKYSVEEVSITNNGEAVTNYTPSYSEVDGGFKITNTINQDTVEISGTKTWVDPEGTEHPTITIQLLRDGKEYQETSLENGTTDFSFKGLPKYAVPGLEDAMAGDKLDGHEFVYTIQEVEVDGYSSSMTGKAASGFVVTNTINQVPVKVYGTKHWEDASDQDGKRPESITVKLYADGEVATDINGNTVADQEVTGTGNDWTWEFTNLPKYDANGAIIQYTVDEILPEGSEYTSAITGNATNGYVIANSYTPEVTSVSVEKVWVDGNNAEGKQPATVMIRLKASYTDADGNEQTESYGDAVTLPYEGQWGYTFSNLPVNMPGQVNAKVTYTVEELNTDTNYVDSVSGTQSDGYVVTNTIKQVPVKVYGTKHWEDASDQDGKRPESITVKLYADGEVATDIDGNTVADQVVTGTGNDWTWGFTNLPKYDANGAIIEYTVKEIVTTGDTSGWEHSYTVAPIGEDEDDGDDFKYTITNSYTPELTEVSVTKVWEDANNQDNLRPGSITVELWHKYEGANGTVVEKKIKEAVLKADNWSYTFTELPVYAEGEVGAKVTYTVREAQVVGYEDPTISGDTEKGYTITNKHEPELTEVSVTKVWDDDGDRDGLQPGSITVELWHKYECANGTFVEEKISEAVLKADNWSYTFTKLPVYAVGEVGARVTYTVREAQVEEYDEPTITVDAETGYTITNKHEPALTEISVTKAWVDPGYTRPSGITVNLLADGEEIQEAVLTAESGWTHTFTDLFVYRDHGVEIVYTITEDPIYDDEGALKYNTEISGLNIKNTIAQRYINISGLKHWVAPADRAHPAITIRLYRDGVEIAKDILIDGDVDYNFLGLPKYAVACEELKYYDGELDGHEFEYTVKEDVVHGYSSEFVNGDFVNTINQDYVSVNGTKTWNDPEGTAHPEITIHLYRDGVEVGVTTLADGEVNYSFEHLPKYAVECAELADYTGEMDAHEFVYTVSEDVVPGYTSVQEGNNFINTIEQEWIPVSVNKVWIDRTEDAVHPTITIHLLQNGVRIDSVILFNGRTSYTFENLPKYNLEDGSLYVYTAREDDVDGYTSRAEGLTVINTEDGPEMITISGTKTWDDGGLEHNNAEEVIITLMRRIAGGEYTEVTDTPIVWEGNRYYFRNLMKYDEDGNLYEYTISEAPVEGYATFYEGYNIINRLTYDVVEVEISGTKYWNDNDNANGKRPESVTIQLMRDGEVIDTVSITAEDNWSYSFKNLPDNDGFGVYYTYTVTEQLVPGYWLRVEGNDLYNTEVPEEEEPEIERFRRYREEELEELITLFDYGVPLWGGLLGTGDEIPVYPFVFGGMGLLALAAYILLNRKGKRS